MSNLSDISEPYCAIANLQNYILCAYPNFLVLGKPLKTDTGVKYEKKTYFKIRSSDFETWFNNLKCAFDWFGSNEIDVEILTFLEHENVKYSWNCEVKNEKKVLTLKKNERNEELIFHFDFSELKVLLSSLGELLMDTYCLSDNVMQILYHVLSHFLSYQNCSVEKVANKIVSLDYSKTFELCKYSSQMYQIEGSLFSFTQYVLKHKVNISILFQIKKMC